MSNYNGRVVERGNGFPDVGDYVPDNAGGLVRVVAIGRIETGRSPGAGNWCRAKLEPADWDDCPEGDEHPSCAGIDDQDDQDTAYGYTFADWLAAAGRTDSASEYDLRAAWRAGEDPAEYARWSNRG